MNIPEYNTGISDDFVSNLALLLPKSNESLSTTPDYSMNSSDHHGSYSSGSSDLALMLQQFFSKLSDNQTMLDLTSSSSSNTKTSPQLSFVSSLPSSSNDENSYRLLAIVSLCFVLLINPIVILFGVIGNLLATYILINCNIAKLPVSFYTIMLNISDTLNLLIPVFIFWLDNCINRTPERGYFRDKSNFLCKALMCPDQLFAALSAWYMCAISFNRWYSVCRPSSYFFRHSFQASRKSHITLANHHNHLHDDNCGARKRSSASAILTSPSSLVPICFPFDSSCLTTFNIRYRQHLQAFRSIGIITLIGILCCLYPIFMHEIRPVISTKQHFFDLTEKVTHTYAVVWKRCYYSQKHEYAYDIIGIILSCLLHVLPLTFVAAMNIMIIVRLRQRQRQMSNATYTIQSPSIVPKKRVQSQYSPNGILDIIRSTTPSDRKRSSSPFLTTHKDQSTLTDLSPHSSISTKSANNTPKRHHARDRTITIMLVSVALSYIILTIPYRLFWSYNVYIKRMHPEKLNSSVYLLKMHYIDHVLRTIRNIHFGTNFIFFIFLSKTFRRKFQQLFLGRRASRSSRLFSQVNLNKRQSRERPSNLEELQARTSKLNELNQQILHETASLMEDACIQEEKFHSILEIERDDKIRDL